MTSDNNTSVPASGPIVARVGSYYRNVRLVLVAAALAGGLWFLYDGFVKYPAQNAQDLVEHHRKATEAYLVSAGRGAEVEAQKARGAAELAAWLDGEYRRNGAEIASRAGTPKFTHSETDLLLQRAIGFVLPVASLALLVRVMTRGRLRMEGDTLHIPGHPPITLSQITRIDKRLWDRKGIAWIDYEVADGKTGAFKLDDFVYDRKPTDAIFERIEQYAAQPTE